MKVNLVVTQGSLKGKEIPITRNQFLIGRDPQCQLRPASPMISRRHCAILIHKGKVVVRDFGSTNGTLVNDQRVEGERELHDRDILKMDPLVFSVRIEAGPTVNKRTPLPDGADEESIAALLLDLKENSPSLAGADSDGVPTGTTILEIPAAAKAEEIDPESGKGKDKKQPDKKVVASGDTSHAAKSILDKYSRRKKT